MAGEEKGKKRTSENIAQYWEKQAEKMGLDPTVTIRDHYFRELEISEIRKLLKNTDKVLDVGCGNGYSTIFYAQDVKEIVGIDYSKKIIEAAHELLKNFPEKEVAIKNNIKFEVGNVLKLQFLNNSFDTVISERCLINMPDKDSQNKAMLEIHRVLKPKGRCIMVEVTEQGHAYVNRLRNMFGLDDLMRHWHNLYLDESSFFPFVSQYFNILDVKRFGMYHFISKVIHPLLVAPEEPKFDAKINEVAKIIGSKITNFEDCSHHVMFVLEKK